MRDFRGGVQMCGGNTYDEEITELQTRFFRVGKDRKVYLTDEKTELKMIQGFEFCLGRW